MTVRYNKTKDIHAVLNTLSGNADLYVKYYDTSAMKIRDNWILPTTTDHDAKSEELLR